MKHLSITTRLFAAVLAVGVAVAVAMGVAAHWSFETGFIGHLNRQAEARLDSSLPRLQQAWRENGASWDFLRDRPDRWHHLVGVGRRDRSEPLDEAERQLMATELLGAGRRLTLLDAQRQRVFGYPEIKADSIEREIKVDGATVGWLVLAPIESVADAAADEFLAQQLRTSLAAGVLVVALSALAAWWVARRLLRPVRDMAAATHRLAAGAYDTRVVADSRDELGQLAHDFNQLALALGRTEQLRRDFMADISHELRTPLAILHGEIEALIDGIHRADADTLALLQSQTATLNQLVADLHELALADVGALTYQRTDLDLVLLLRREGEALAHACAAQSLSHELQLPATPVLVQADAARLSQLLHNLYANALRYTDAPGLIRVQLQREGDEAVLDVQDSKPGVPPELLPRLFERFFRAERSRDRRSGGSGLGLAICRSIVEAHGGHIEARASELGGLWVQVRLPLLASARGTPAGNDRASPTA